MSPFTREGRLLGAALKKAFPGASADGLKKARQAAAYGASPAQIARIMVEDTKQNAQTIKAKEIKNA